MGKIYIASSLKNREQVLELQKQLKASGIEQTFNWAAEPDGQLDEELEQWLATSMRWGVEQADLVVLITPGGRGAHVEFGMAVALEKPVFVYSIEKGICFYKLAKVFDDFNEMMRDIVAFYKVKLTPAEKLKQLLVFNATGQVLALPGHINDAMDHLDDALNDAKSELRSGEFETEVLCESSRHYESKSVAAKMLDGSYVGWTYWYGGGKHGEPESIEWIEDAYEVKMFETCRMAKEFQRV